MFWLRFYRRFVGEVCVKFCNSSTINDTPVAKKDTYSSSFTKQPRRHDICADFRLARCVQMPFSGVGAVMLPYSNKDRPF